MMSPVARVGETESGRSGGAASRAGTAKRAGSRRAPRPRRGLSRPLLLLAAGITGCVVAWGYLVYAAVDFGRTARAGDAAAWWFLGLAALGGVACLFVGLMLGARLLRAVGVVADRSARPVGGRRAAR